MLRHEVLLTYVQCKVCTVYSMYSVQYVQYSVQYVQCTVCAVYSLYSMYKQNTKRPAIIDEFDYYISSINTVVGSNQV
jgi:hypothetical protein